MECVIETKASTILQCIDGLRGDFHVTFEEGTSAAWLYEPHGTELIVCDPRKNASMREDSQNDKIDAGRLARSEQLCCSAFCRLRTASEPSGRCGNTVVWS
jgi:hypothetical protein